MDQAFNKERRVIIGVRPGRLTNDDT